MMESFVSVVTPVHNGEKYLSQCIQSVLDQTYANWEYIIVENCSTDRSFEIAKSYASKDKRIKIYRNANLLDAIDNFNYSLKKISPESKYCKVVHADDWIFKDCVEKMVEVAETYPTVGIVSAYRLEENFVSLDGLPYPSHFVAGNQICRTKLMKGPGAPYLFGSPTSLLLRSDLILKRDKFYVEPHEQTDFDACFDLLKESDFGFVHQVLTFTRRHNESRSSEANRKSTNQLYRFKMLLKYGPFYLNTVEYQQAVKDEIRRYHRFIARKLIEPGSRKTISFHYKELKDEGYSINKMRLLYDLLKEILNIRSAFWRLRGRHLPAE